MVRSSLQSQVVALEREQGKLIRKVSRKQEQIADIEQGCRELCARMLARLHPLTLRSQELDEAIHDMFRCILTNRKLGKRSYKAIFRVYMNLQDIQLISARPFEPQGSAQAELFADDMSELDMDPDMDSGAAGDDADWHFPRIEPSPDREARKGSLRALFLQLASRFHPDLATSADAEQQHTEIMKELTSAYREGDLARLLKLQRELESRGAIEPRESGELSLKNYLARLQEQVAHLKEQVRTLARHLEAVRNTPVAELLLDYRRLLQTHVGDPIDLFIEDMQEDIEVLEEVTVFVRQFHDRKMTIKRFLEGPSVLQGLDDEDLLMILEQELAATARSRSRHR